MTARILIELDDDEMHAWLRVLPGDPLDADALPDALASAGIAFGIDAAALADVAAQLHDPEFACDPLPIASGRPMERESDGACELTLAVGLQSGHRNEDGSFDYRDRGLLTPVAPGQLVAHCRPAVAGMEGRTVTDRRIPCDHARAGGPTFGDGFARDVHGNVLATRGGVLRTGDNAAITVDDHYVHEGNVDIHSGHLEMRGALTITGEVTAKFDAQATGDVEIGKSVARGTVYSGANVRVAGGVVATGGGAVLAELDVAAEHGQGAVIHCGGTVHLRRAAINCELVARTIKVDGAVRGGLLLAEHAIVVGDAGARMGGETELAVAVELERPIRPRFDELRRERHLAERLAAQVVHVRARERRVAPPGSPEALEHAARIHALALVAHIDVLGTIHPGCTIAIGAHRLVLDRAAKHCRFTIDPETAAIRSDPLP